MVNRLVIYWYIPCHCVVKNMALVVHCIGCNQFIKNTKNDGSDDSDHEIESKQARCPSCHNLSHRRHSHYVRQLKDLPLGDREVQLFLCSNKWFCDHSDCAVKVFTERLNWIDPYRRRTRRLEEQLTTLAFSTSCLQAEKLCKLFHISVSHDALLDLIYRKNQEPETHFPFRRSG